MEDLSPQSSQQEQRKLIEHLEQVLSGEDGGKATQTDATDCGIQEDPNHPEEVVQLLIRRRCGMPANAWGSCILSTLIYRRWISGEFFVVGGLQMFGLVCTIATQLVLLEFLAFLADERHRGDDQVEECTTMNQPTGQIGQIFGSPTWVCAIVLGAYIYANEIRETLSMFNFINQIPAPERSQSRFWYSKDESDKDKSDKDKEALDLKWFGNKEENVAKPTRGIAWWHRIAIYILLLLKGSLSIWLATSSFDFIIFTTEMHEILLNCTATLFILEVDDICFKLVNPTHLFIFFSNYPVFPEPNPEARLKWWKKRIKWCSTKMQCCCPWLTHWSFLQMKEPRQCSRQANLPDGLLLTEWGTWFQIALDGSFASCAVFFGAIQCWAFYCSEDFVYYDNSSSDFTNKKVFMQRAFKRLWQFSGVVLLLSIASTVTVVAIAACCDQSRVEFEQRRSGEAEQSRREQRKESRGRREKEGERKYDRTACCCKRSLDTE